MIMKNLLFTFGVLLILFFSSCYATVRAPGPPPVYRHPRWHRQPRVRETIIIRGELKPIKVDNSLAIVK